VNAGHRGLTHNEARRIAANIAKLPGVVLSSKCESIERE